MMTLIERWEELNGKFGRLWQRVHPFIRRAVRFAALPYCYVSLINWNECNKAKWKVAGDLLYIFFKLKYYPDNYSLCRLWEKPRDEWVYYYGSNYDPYQRRQLMGKVQKREYEILFEDKNVCRQLCLAAGLPVPIQYSYSENESDLKNVATDLIKKEKNKKLIIKYNLGRAGNDIYVLSNKNNEIVAEDNRQSISLKDLKIKLPSVLQEFVVQHKDFDRISKSVNTVRIATLLTKYGNVLILGALMRFGVGDTYIDNTSKGGIAVGIDIKSGRLMKTAFDFKSKTYLKHPTSKREFYGLQVPWWDKVVDLAVRTQKHFNYFKLLGHDIAISENGPIIIELNAIYDNVGLEQSCGPILRNRDVLKAYDEYDLLINQKQKALLFGPNRKNH